MDHWGSKHFKPPSVMNKHNPKTLCILLDYICVRGNCVCVKIHIRISNSVHFMLSLFRFTPREEIKVAGTTGTAHTADQSLRWRYIKFLSYYVNNSFDAITDLLLCWSSASVALETRLQLVCWYCKFFCLLLYTYVRCAASQIVLREIHGSLRRYDI